MSRRSAWVRLLVSGTVAVPVVSAAAAPAAAQFYPYPPAYPPAPPAVVYGNVQPHEADGIVRSLGLTPIAAPRPHGPVIIVHALGREGSQVQVTLDRRTGRVRQIIRVGYGAPLLAPVLPGARPYGPPPADPGFFDDDDDEEAAFGSGPRVITREGIESRQLPPPGTGPQVVTREPEITGSTPRTSSGPVDPLLGVPKEFRGRSGAGEPPQTMRPSQRLAARTPGDSIPRVAPMPRPRPADAPSIAQRDSAPEKAETAKPSALQPPVKPDRSQDDVPVQPLE
jgi:hypothetical protein